MLKLIRANHHSISRESHNHKVLEKDLGYFRQNSGNTSTVPPQAEREKNTHFYMSAQLDTTRINRDVQRLVEEVISHLISADGCKIEVSLEVNAKTLDGFPPPTVRTISENCRTLKVQDFGFDE